MAESVTEEEVLCIAEKFADVFRKKLPSVYGKYSGEKFTADPFGETEEFLISYIARHADETDKTDAARRIKRAKLIPEGKELEELLLDMQFRKKLAKACGMLKRLPNEMLLDGEKALTNALISRYQLKRYISITDLVDFVDVSKDPDFQKDFCTFCGIQDGEDWRKGFFEAFQQIKESRTRDFSSALNTVHGKTGTYEAVYTSMMLAIMDDRLPILNSSVRDALNLGSYTGFDNAVKAYDRLKKWYGWYMNTEEAEDNIILWKTTFRDWPEYAGISRVKIIDFMIWGSMEEG